LSEDWRSDRQRQQANRQPHKLQHRFLLIEAAGFAVASKTDYRAFASVHRRIF
jgi:hypothetical protein